MKDLKSQLLEFAAKRAVSEIVGIAARNMEKQARNGIQNHRVRKALQSSKPLPTSTERTPQMARTDTAGFSGENTRNQANAAAAQQQNQNQAKEPIEFWVNDCIVYEDGGQPIRLLTGRPLKAFKANRDVNTANEEFNQVNILNNSFVDMLNEDAAQLNFGESRYYSPAGIKKDKEGNQVFKAGIYLQLHREKTDHAAAAAEKMDLEAAEKQRLRKLFGG